MARRGGVEGVLMGCLHLAGLNFDRNHVSRGTPVPAASRYDSDVWAFIGSYSLDHIHASYREVFRGGRLNYVRGRYSASCIAATGRPRSVLAVSSLPYFRPGSCLQLRLHHASNTLSTTRPPCPARPRKVLNGQSWVVVDGAILDVTNFSQRHPGGTRLIQNAVGTDVTHELLGESLSVGHAMSFSPHIHPEVGMFSCRRGMCGVSGSLN